MVRLNDFEKQWKEIHPAVLQAVDRVGRSGWLILGKEVESFEQQLASYCKSAHAIGCASGLDAIEIGLRLLGLKPGDLVITTPLSAFATTLAIVRAGGVPLFMDVDENGNLDLEQVRSFLQNEPSPPTYLLPVHLFGHSLELDSLTQLRDRFSLQILEDCAQAIGATSGSRPVGTVGQVSAISFYPTKNLGCMGDGGALLTGSGAFAEQARAIRDYGQTEKYVHSVLGLNSRLDEVQAAIMSDALLPRLDEFTESRRRIASLYCDAISHPQITIPKVSTPSGSVYHLFPILVDGDRGSFRNHLRNCGVESAIHYPIIIPEQAALQHQPFRVAGSLPMASRFAQQEVSLPINPYLEESEITTVVDACNSWIST